MKVIFAGIVVLLASGRLFAQETALSDTSGKDSSKISVLQLGTSYGNTANYYGQTTTNKLPYASLDISYKSKTGLWVATSATQLTTIKTGGSEIDVAAGYDFDLTKRLSGTVSYTHFFFSKNSPLPQSVNPNAASAQLTYDFKWFNASAYGDYVFGNIKDNSGNSVNSLFLTGSLSREFDLGSLFSKNDYITISPSVSFIGGRQLVTATTASTEKPPTAVHQLTQYSVARAQTLGYSYYNQEPGKRQDILPNVYYGREQDNQQQSISNTSFSLITSMLKVPLGYNRAHYTIEGAYQLSLPNKKFEGIVPRNQSFFTLSFTYLFYKLK